MTRYLVLSFALSVFISACAVAPPAIQAPVDHNAAKVQQFLISANTALEQNRLTTPAENSALAGFRQVLAIDPANAVAIDGINRIVEKYLSWALDHAEQSNLSRARHFVTKAEEIDPDHPNIQPVVNKINDQEDKVVSIFKLDAASVRNQSIDPIQLNRIAAKIQRDRAFITIRAPDDPSGRWLYQELNRRVDFRIEARFKQSKTASVSLTL